MTNGNWEAMWTRGIQPGEYFDASRTEPAFQALLDNKNLQPPLPRGKALVPGCGRGYAVASLVVAGFSTTGIEISKTAADTAKQYLASRDVKASILEGDFFDMDLPAYDLVFDSTFLCAIDPSTRADWAKRMAALVTSGGELVTNIFPIRPDGEPDPADGAIGTGPPYALSPRLVAGLLAPHGFEKVSLDIVPPAQRARGKEYIARWRKLLPKS
mmetsp:Transcript_20525/g.68912  ORF Transcript_20525/g.68912 Transcript_20525/m.68912 type:complete len:214 (+) Transcript_20525:65-706(+)